MTFEEIWNLLDNREIIIVHMKDSMEPKLLNVTDEKLFSVPEGYIAYDKNRYFRKF
tara:strand:+ start:131 stop:298 length:168 start_codon:yes stop_codon:yes gene_type:complete